MSGVPSDLPPSYEEAQQNTAYPPSYPGQNDDFPKQNGPAGYGFQPPPVGGQQPYPPQTGFNQQYPYGAPQTGPYPPQGPYPTQSGPQTYNYPTAVAAYNQQGVVVQPGMRPTPLLVNQRRKKMVLTIAVAIFVFIFITIMLRIII